MFDRTLTAALILVSLFAAFMTRLYFGEKEHFSTYRASVIAAGEAQERQTMETINKQKQIAKNVKDDYETRIASLRAAYRVRPSNPGTGLMPPAPVTAFDFNGRTPNDVFADCAETTQQLVSLQDFIKRTQ